MGRLIWLFSFGLKGSEAGFEMMQTYFRSRHPLAHLSGWVKQGRAAGTCAPDTREVSRCTTSSGR